jgi:hypothetical protein
MELVVVVLVAVALGAIGVSIASRREAAAART